MRTGRSKNLPLFRYAFKKAKKARSNSSIYSWLVVMALAETAPPVYWKIFHSDWNPGKGLKGNYRAIGDLIHKKVRPALTYNFGELSPPTAYKIVIKLQGITSLLMPYAYGILSIFHSNYVGEKAVMQYIAYRNNNEIFKEYIERNWRKVNDTRRKNTYITRKR